MRLRLKALAAVEERKKSTQGRSFDHAAVTRCWATRRAQTDMAQLRTEIVRAMSARNGRARGAARSLDGAERLEADTTLSSWTG